MTTAQHIDIEPFLRSGYQIFAHALDSLEPIRQFLQSHIDRQVDAAAREIGCGSRQEFAARIATEASAAGGTIDSLTKDTRDTLSGHFDLRARLDRKLWDVPRQPRLQQILHAALRSDLLYMHMPPTARFVLPGNVHAGVPPHQDISYNQHMSDFVTVWTPLVDIDDACGGVVVYEGSGSAPEASTGPDRDRFWLKGIPVDGYRPVHCLLRVGDVLLLNKRIVHASMPNQSTRTRLSIDFRFFGAHDQSHKHYLDMQTWNVVAPREAA